LDSNDDKGDQAESRGGKHAPEQPIGYLALVLRGTES
jgi:hypothetical protein